MWRYVPRLTLLLCTHAVRVKERDRQATMDASGFGKSLLTPCDARNVDMARYCRSQVCALWRRHESRFTLEPAKLGCVVTALHENLIRSRE